MLSVYLFGYNYNGFIFRDAVEYDEDHDDECLFLLRASLIMINILPIDYTPTSSINHICITLFISFTFTVRSIHISL